MISFSLSLFHSRCTQLKREYISRFMNTARAILRTSKTSKLTINFEVHEQLHMVFYLSYIQQNYPVAFILRVARVRILQFWVYFSFSGLCLQNLQPGLCSFQRIFVFFSFSSSCSTMFWFDKATVRHYLVKFDASPMFPWQLPYCTV